MFNFYLFLINTVGASQMVRVVKNLPANAGDVKRCGFDPWVRKIPWRREWQPTPVFLPGKSHGQRSLVGYSSWRGKESDATEQLSPHAINTVAKPPSSSRGGCYCMKEKAFGRNTGLDKPLFTEQENEDISLERRPTCGKVPFPPR